MKEIEIVSGTITLTDANQLIRLSVERIGTYEGRLYEHSEIEGRDSVIGTEEQTA